MQVPIRWLKELVNIDGISPEDIAYGLTMAGLEVESVETVSIDFHSVKIVKILSIQQHPNADKLTLVKVSDGTTEYDVVCGAKNTSEGHYVPLAVVGAEVLDRKTGQSFQLKPTVIRGVESQGMLCSPDELGLQEKYKQEDGILILNKFYPEINEDYLGTPLEQFLNLEEEIILHVIPTANRGDLMSMRGVAKEISAIFNRALSFHHENIPYTQDQTAFQVEIIDPETCPYYSLAVLKNLKIGPSPDWMVKRIEASGMRSINNVVDITNYIMLEYGQPLHAFDLSQLHDKYLCVRYAKPEERLITLDDADRKLSGETVVIADKNNPVAVAGVMGGHSSEVTENTVHLALESACFDPVKTRRSSKSIALRTEASARFERGVDLCSVKIALLQAVWLLQQYAGAELTCLAETGQDHIENKPVQMRYTRLSSILGISISRERCSQILESLGFKILSHSEETIEVDVPSYRANDIYREIDLIEEIIRVYGYNKVPETVPTFHTVVYPSLKKRLTNKISHMLVGYGFKEIITSSLVGNELTKWAHNTLDEAYAVKVANPQSDEYTTLRQSLIPNLLKVVKYNMDRNNQNLALFEFGKKYLKTHAATQHDAGVTETKCLSIALSGKINQAVWKNKNTVDFYTLKGIVESILQEFKLAERVELVRECPTYFHPGRSASLMIRGKNGKQLIGFLGELHPKVLSGCDLSTSVYSAELNFDLLIEQAVLKEVKFKQLPKYPLVERDISFWIDTAIPYSTIKSCIQKSKAKYLKGIKLFDIYKDKEKPDIVSLAIRLELQNIEQTLTELEIEQDIANIKQTLEKECQVKLR